MIEIPDRERLTVENVEETLVTQFTLIQTFFASQGVDPRQITEAIKRYASLYAKLQLQRVGQEYMRAGSFNIGRAIIEKAENL